MNKNTWVFSVLFATTTLAFSQQALQSSMSDSTKVQHLDEVVITDSKFKLKRENSGKVITKITQEELKNFQGKTVAEIINTTSGIEINGTKSNAGQNLAYYIRGGRNRQVLVLIDGIAVTDPSQIANDYDLRLLNPNQIESIEILKGASSTLYGSGAATAVINIKLKKATQEKVQAQFKSILGTNQSQKNMRYTLKDFRNNVLVNGTLGKFTYLAGFGNQFTDGLSAVNQGTDSDFYNAINGNVKLGYTFSDKFNIHAYANFDKFKAEFDDSFLLEDANNLSTSKQYRVGIAPKFNYQNGSIILNAAHNKVERTIESMYPARFTGKSFMADVYNKYIINHTFYTIQGMNTQHITMESFTIPYGETAFEQSISPENAKFTIVDPYINLVYISKFGLQLNAGTRLNIHSEYGSHLVYSVNPSFTKKFNFGQVKLLTSYSTAYITPSLYQLFEPAYGNESLQPEENTTVEAGVDINFKNTANLSVIYFNRREKNFIDFVDAGNFTYQYNNVAEQFTASGIEFTGRYNITKTLAFHANATYTRVEKNLNLRIPEMKANARLDYNLNKSTFLSLVYQFNDNRTDSVYNQETFRNESQNLKSYQLWDFHVNHSLLKNKLMLLAYVTNILNENYQELYGYTTRGRNVGIGFNLRL
ncbi:MAG TPA: TonB-dependent receptor plug domain-containing protein [Flavobacteriaceae bacterium]|nr:TonB-dependent receptor plug domain-containing protein [Flavobacteriaceae bacterium]